MEEDNQQSSQLALSHDPSSPTTPRPAKRPRTNTPRENASVVICLDDEDVPLSQVSPNKPPRAPKDSYQSLVYVLSDSDEDEIVQMPTPQPPHIRYKVEHDLRHDAKAHALEVNQPRSFNRQRNLIKPKVEPKLERVFPKSEVDIDHRNEETTPISSAIRLSHLPADAIVPDDFDFPSPPPSSEDECDKADVVQEGDHRHPGVKTGSNVGLQVSAEGADRMQLRRPIISDTFDPTICSQDSAYFSFSKQEASKNGNEIPPGQHVGVSFKTEPEELKPVDRQQRREPYYSKAFDYVLTEVLSRYRDILRPCEADLATLMKTELSRDGLALFVRIYRRKQPHWYRTAHLHTSYGDDIDVDAGVAELCTSGLVISSLHAAKGGKKVTQLVARELVKGLRAPELKAVLSSVSDSKSLRKLSSRKLLPALQGILSEKPSQNGRKKFKQATLTGLSQADCLSRAVLKKAGHSIKIPEHVLEQLQRMHFLFFLEDGHDSPNVILADTGKAKFPDYECRRERKIFPSSFAFEDYESAVSLESRLNRAMENKDNMKATHYGSIAELEMREHLIHSIDDERFEAQDKCSGGLVRCSPSHSATGNARVGWTRSPRRKMLDREEARAQLEHPFFRRYTAHWVYVRTAWHSVTALERLGEYEVAVQRLRLLLSTGLMPRRRGKCLNRLTINLYKHLERPGESLNVILSALQEESLLLHFGDRIALANRGIAIHRKLTLPSAEDKAKRTIRKKSDRKKAAIADVIESRPSVLEHVLSGTQTTIKVRKLYGKSLQIAGRERKRKLQETEKDPWEVFKVDHSRESIASTTTQDSAILGKSKYTSRGSSHAIVSVENYCLEWYLGKEGWSGVHDEGNSLRFLYTLLFWECALFAQVEDVFQTPYQDRPLDLFTEAFYVSRKERIDEQLATISSMEAHVVRDEVLRLYKKYEPIRAIGCAWNTYSAEDLSHIAAGFGGRVLSQCCKLLSVDYAYWGGGLPDLTLWKPEGLPGTQTFDTRLVEVKSPRDTLSERQRAWLIELKNMTADCEVCKVVEKVTERNAADLESASLDSIEISAIDAANAMDDVES